MNATEALALITDVHGVRYTYPDIPEGVWKTDKINIICPIHGAFQQQLHRHLAGRGCHSCGGSKKLTQEQFIEGCAARHNGFYTYENTVYKDSKTKIAVTCPTHGEFLVLAGAHKHGRGCARCAGSAQSDTTEFIAKAHTVHGDTYDYSLTVYDRARSPVIIGCTIHGTFSQTPNEHLGGGGCKQCGVARRGHSQRKSTESFVIEAIHVHGNRYDYSGVVYTTAKAKVRIRCVKHGVFEQQPNNHLNGNGCPECTMSGTSKIEQSLFTAFPMAVAHDRTVLKDREIDMLIDGRVGVEINGVYWHTEAQGKHRNYHLDKTERAHAQGVELLQFTDREVNDKFDLVCSMIHAKLGSTPNKIYARKCKIGVVPNAVAMGFCNEHHMQGGVVSSVRYGLWYDGELVALMTFSKSRFSGICDWEIVRFAVKKHTTVVGGASKLFTHFTRRHAGSVVSYANRRWSQGKLYEALGFTLAHVSAPNYYWVASNGCTTLSRNKCQKHKLASVLGEQFDPTLSEAGNMQQAGYSRMWDCGNMVYIYTA